MKTTFQTKILGFGNNAAIEVPAANVSELGAGKRAPVEVILEKYMFQSTLGNMGGKTLVPLSKAHRALAGVEIGEKLQVTLKLVTGFREVEIPSELQEALEREGLMPAFTAHTYASRKEFCRQVADAKSIDTKLRRVEKIILELAKQK